MEAFSSTSNKAFLARKAKPAEELTLAGRCAILVAARARQPPWPRLGLRESREAFRL